MENNGAVGAVGGDVAGQLMEQRGQDNISITSDNFAEKATIGAVTGAIDGLSGGAFGIVGKTATASTKALQSTMSSNIVTTATALTGQGATQATVNSAVNSITKGMGVAGVNTANSMLKVEAAAPTATEITAKVVEEQIKKKK